MEGSKAIDIIDATNDTLIATVFGNTTEPPLVDSSEDLSTSITDTILRICYIVIGSLGIGCNALVIVVLLQLKNLKQKVSCLYIINQSIADFLTAVFLLLPTVLPDDGRQYTTLGDELYCRLWISRTPLWLFMHSSAWSLVALTIERYLAVVYPLRHRMTFTYGKALLFIVLVWLFCLVYNLSNLVPTTFVSEGRCVLYVFKSDSARRASGIIGVIVNYYVPIFILIFCYTKMAVALKQKIAPVDGQTIAVNNTQSTAKRNIIKTLVIVSTAFILCTSWNQWFFFLYNVGALDYSAFNTNGYHVSVVLMFANCCINPFIYTAKYKTFQKSLWNMFCHRQKRKNEQQQQQQGQHPTSAST